VHIFGGGKGVSGAVVPIGNIDDADVFIETSSKPKMKEKKNSKWGNKGAESLTTETALQFMIKERALMDLETAKLKRENDELRRGLDRGGPSSSAPPPSSSGDGERQTDEQLKEELKRVMHENERLKLRQMTEGGDNASAASAVPAPPLSMLVQRGPLRGPIGAPAHAPAAAAAAVAGLGLSSYSAGKKTSHIGPPQQQPSFETDVLTIAARLWDGGYLWKIPYNGKGDPDKRIVALKRAKVYPSPGSRAVIIDRGGVKSKPEHFIVFPPTLVWYNSDKPGEVKNARELILYEGSCLMEGHNTNAFHKLLSRDKSIPRAELCFSMMTSTRSLDLAADRIEDADAWKDALHMLLVELCPNKQWGIENLRRAKPFWNNTLEKPPPAAADNSSKGRGGKGVHNNNDNNNASQKQLPAAALATGPKAGAKPLRKEAIKKQVFNACKAGDCAMVESMFKAGVPANLVDEKSNSDTPLMVACQIGNEELVKLCLQYGAKNDPHPDFGETALHMACRYGHVAAAEVILQAAAQSDADAMICNLTNEEAQTPLHLAAGNGHRAMVDVLLGHGAALDCRDELDQTVLHVSSGAGHRDVVATLLDQGGDHLLEYPDLGGSTPLHYAAQNGHLFVIKQLLETAADVTARTMQGQTAYKLAMDRGHTQIATLLLEYMKDYKVSTNLLSGGMAKKNAASTNISRTGRLTIDTVDSHGNGSAHVDEEELLAQGLGYDHHDAQYGDGEGADGEVSLQINSHLPPSPKSAYGTPFKGGGGVAPPPLELPRPHTQSSPVPSAGYRKAYHSPNTSMSTPQKGGGAAGVNGMELSPGNGGYRVLDRSPIQPGGDNRMRASSEGMLPPPHTSPVQTGYSNSAAYGAYVGQGHSPNPGNFSARDGYPPHGAASDMYSPMSARERPAPAIFDGMHMQQHGYAVQSPPPPASGGMIASPIVGYDNYQQQQQHVWNHATQQWEYPPQQQHAQGYPQGYQQQPGLYDPHQQQQQQQQYDQQQGYDQHHQQQHYQQQPQEWASTAGAGYDQHQHQQQHHYNDSSGGDGAIEEQPSVAVESYEEPEERFESSGRFWAVYRTEEGHRYFLDSAAEHSQWEDPREVGVLFVDYEAEAAAAEEDEAKFGDGAGIAAVHGSPQRGPGDGAAFLHHNYKLSSPKSSPPKSPSAAGSRAAAARSFFPAGPSMVAAAVAGDGDMKGDGDIGRSPLVTRLFDDDAGAKQSSSSSSQPQRRVDISPDTSDDEAAAPPEIVIRGSRSHVRKNSSSSSNGGRNQQQQPVSPSRVSAPKNMLPPPISTARDSDEDDYGQDEKSESDYKDDEGATTHTGPSPPAEEKQSSSQSDFKAIDIDFKGGDNDAAAPAASASASTTDAKSDRGERGRRGGRSGSDRSASRSRSRSRAGDAKSEDLAAPSASLSMASKLEAIAAARKADRIKDMDKGSRPSAVASNKDGSAAAAAADVGSAADSKADSGGDRWADSKSGGSSNSSSTAVSDAKPGSSLPDTAPQSKAASAPVVPVQPPSARKAKYVQMLKDGENLRVVRREMEANDEDKGLIREILALADEIAPAPEAAVASSGGGDAKTGGAGAAALSSSVVKEDMADLKQDPVVGKYAKMAGMGIPGPAVAMKMKNEDVPVDQMNRILAALDLPLEASGPAEEMPKEELSDLKQDAIVGKYAKMAAMGVPHASVQAKMRIDAVEQSQQNRILRALGIDTEDGDGSGGPPPGPSPMGALAALAAGPGGRSMPRRPSVPMQTMHWNAIPKDKLEKSIWAASVEGDGDEIQEDDMAEIEKLFGKEEKKPARGAWGDGGAAGAPGGAAGEGGAKQPPKKDRLMLIDGKRAQNVTIGLSQFKSLGTFQELLRAVCSLDSLGGRLTIDHLENLQNILPSDSEIKDSARMIESLHPAEAFLRTAAQYCPDLPQRLHCFITCSHFGDNCANGLSRARKVITACNEVISSDKLARVLQKMLAVGNIMNQGTFRGNATGFTVDSLLRMINMKGADKKTSVLDYVVKSLYDRGEERVLVVADDLQVVEECVRMSGKEITRALSDLLATFDTLKQESDSVKERRVSGEVHSPTPQRSGDGGTSPARQQLASTSQLFSEKLQGRIADFSSSTEEVAKVRTLMERKVRELVEYFGEDANECDTTTIFSVLQQFRRALHESKAAVERKNKAAARASTGGPSERRSSMA
jgi:ankyrin repeat protein